MKTIAKTSTPECECDSDRRVTFGSHLLTFKCEHAFLLRSRTDATGDPSDVKASKENLSRAGTLFPFGTIRTFRPRRENAPNKPCRTILQYIIADLYTIESRPKMFGTYFCSERSEPIRTLFPPSLEENTPSVRSYASAHA